MRCAWPIGAGCGAVLGAPSPARENAAGEAGRTRGRAEGARFSLAPSPLPLSLGRGILRACARRRRRPRLRKGTPLRVSAPGVGFGGLRIRGPPPRHRANRSPVKPVEVETQRRRHGVAHHATFALQIADWRTSRCHPRSITLQRSGIARRANAGLPTPDAFAARSRARPFGRLLRWGLAWVRSSQPSRERATRRLRRR
jgi:hypothetical protein